MMGSSMMASVAPGTSLDDSITGVNWTNAPLEGLLDLVTGRMGLGWKYENNQITIYYFDTRTFHVFAFSDKNTQTTTVKSGTSSGNASGGSDSGSFNAEGSSQETKLEYTSDISKDISDALHAMVTPSLGRLSISTSTGAVTVTDRPEVLRRIEAYIEAENKRLTQQVLLRVRIFSVAMEDSDSMGLNWDAVYRNMGSASLSLATNFPASVAGGMSGTMNIINSNSKWDGTSALLNALSSQGQVTMVADPTVTTLNMKPVPVLVGRQLSYLASVSTTTTSGSDNATQSLTPGTLTTGLNMTLRPLIMQGQDMLLRFDLNLSALTEMRTVESGDNKIQLPEVDNRIFSQSVRIKSGQTLVLSGFDQTNLQTDKSGVGDSGFWLLGGQGERIKQRNVVVVTITPIITE